MANELTIEILREIRDGISGLRTEFIERLDQTNARLDQTNARLDQANTRLGNVEQGLADLGKFMRQIALDQASSSSGGAAMVARVGARAATS